MPLKTDLYCNLWDLDSEGIDAALDRIQGELGAAGITVPVLCPPVEELRPHANVSPRWFRSAGGLQYPADPARHRNPHTRPVAAEWLKRRNPLAKLADACNRRGLTLSAWIHGGLSPAMCEANPHMTVRDAFDEPSPRWLCPINPAAEEFLGVVLSDLAEVYGVSAVELDALVPAQLGAALKGGFAAHLPNMGGLWLLGLCFCESCRREAVQNGLDAELNQAGAKNELEILLRTVASFEDPGISDFLAARPLLAAWSECRAATLMRIFKRLCGVLPEAVPLRPVIHLPYLPPWPDAQWAVQEAPGLCLSCECGCESQIQHLLPLIPAVSRNLGASWIALHAEAACATDPSVIIRSLTYIAEAGFEGSHLLNYGRIGDDRLEGFQQALRYARRL